jgi:ABC-type uncharacterized transport system substrate-binding protein
VRRREFITLLGGGAAAWPLAARAQQAPMPVIGFIDPRSPDGMTERLRGFRQGLKDTGYVEGETVAIEYRWAEGQNDRLPTLATDLVRRRVTVIVAGAGIAALAAKTATTTLPIVFSVGEDPVNQGPPGEPGPICARPAVPAYCPDGQVHAGVLSARNPMVGSAAERPPYNLQRT